MVRQEERLDSLGFAKRAGRTEATTILLGRFGSGTDEQSMRKHAAHESISISGVSSWSARGLMQFSCGTALGSTASDPEYGGGYGERVSHWGRVSPEGFAIMRERAATHWCSVGWVLLLARRSDHAWQSRDCR